MNFKVFSGLILLFFTCSSERKAETDLPYSVKETIYNKSFDQTDTSGWVVEAEEKFKLANHISDGAMDIDVSKGITIWNKTKFKGDLMFEFEATVINTSGVNDRVSDLNCFWMATDPAYPENFFERSAWRKGIFHHYYSLNLYYVGYGGHDNTKTRFRKYNGIADPIPEIIQEYSDLRHLLVPNKVNAIRIVCFGSGVQYFFNEEKIFELQDKTPYKEGYFGFRTTNNHMKIKNFKVYSLAAVK